MARLISINRRNDGEPEWNYENVRKLKSEAKCPEELEKPRKIGQNEIFFFLNWTNRKEIRKNQTKIGKLRDKLNKILTKDRKKWIRNGKNWINSEKNGKSKKKSKMIKKNRKN